MAISRKKYSRKRSTGRKRRVKRKSSGRKKRRSSRCGKAYPIKGKNSCYKRRCRRTKSRKRCRKPRSYRRVYSAHKKRRSSGRKRRRSSGRKRRRSSGRKRRRSSKRRAPRGLQRCSKKKGYFGFVSRNKAALMRKTGARSFKSLVKNSKTKAAYRKACH